MSLRLAKPSEFKEARAADAVRPPGRVWKDEWRSKGGQDAPGSLLAPVRVWAIFLGEMRNHWYIEAEEGLCARHVESTFLQSQGRSEATHDHATVVTLARNDKTGRGDTE